MSRESLLRVLVASSLVASLACGAGELTGSVDEADPAYAPAVPSILLYIPLLDDPTLAAYLRTQPGLVEALPASARGRLASAADPQAEYRAIIDEAIDRIEAQGDAEITLILSGHSGGLQVFGSVAGRSVRIDTYDFVRMSLPSIAADHPDFAGRVRHMFVLACNTGWPAAAAAWRSEFPNVTTINAFAGTAPGGGAAWLFFKNTFDRISGIPGCIPMAEQYAATFDALWPASDWPYLNWAHQVVSRCDDVTEVAYNSRISVSLLDAIDRADETKPVFELWFDGQEQGFEDPPADPQTDTANDTLAPRTHYMALHALINAILDEGAYAWYGHLPDYERERDVAHRLVFFRNVKRAWLDDHAVEVQAWLDAHPSELAAAWEQAARYPVGAVTIGLLRDMDRGTTVRLLEELETRIPDEAFFERVRNALGELDPAELPDGYLFDD